MTHGVDKVQNINEETDFKSWGNPIDVPEEYTDRYYLKQEGLGKEDNERTILVNSCKIPVKSKFKSEVTTGKSKKVMSVSTIKSNQQRRRRRRRRQIDLDLTTDCNLEGHYNFFENSSGFNSTNDNKVKKASKIPRSQLNEKKMTNTLKTVEKAGIVNTKISIYEKNLDCAKDDHKNLNNSKRKKAVIGVPLVGMQNGNSSFPLVTVTSCTLKNQNSENPPQCKFNNHTFRSSKKSRSTIRSQKEKQKSSVKKRAPSIPSNAVNFEPISQLAKVTTAISKDIRSVNDFKRSNRNTVIYPVKFTKNPYLTTRSGQSRLGKDSHHTKEVTKTQLGVVRPQSVSSNFRSSGREKRKTLYAKDADGEEAIRVLSNLCLNPLARNSKRASFMMW